MSDLSRRALECHRPVKRKDPLAFGEQYLIHCHACDGSAWRIWQPGDPEIACPIWRESLTARVVTLDLDDPADVARFARAAWELDWEALSEEEEGLYLGSARVSLRDLLADTDEYRSDASGGQS